MAINVNTVYRTVLLILNKEQRGYLTPDEFNKIASQVQLEIFRSYIDDYNQLSRTQQPEATYADRISLLQEKISIFEKTVTSNLSSLFKSIAIGPPTSPPPNTIIFMFF